MKLSLAARHFDNQLFADAYQPVVTFWGQFDLFDDTRRDGMTIERRIISVAPNVTMPARRTVSTDGLVWMIGDSQRDYFKGKSIRHKYVAHQATELVAVKTLEEALAGSPGLSTWSAKIWVKGSKEIDVSSDIFDVFDLYFAANENVRDGQLVNMSGRWYLIRSIYPGSAGLTIALADELPDPVLVTADFKSRVYLPLTDTYSVDVLSVPSIRIRWQSHFKYPVRGTDKFKAGDQVLVVLKSALTPKASDKVDVGGITYRVDSVLDEGACWTMHLCHD